jgi:hypothetical protein
MEIVVMIQSNQHPPLPCDGARSDELHAILQIEMACRGGHDASIYMRALCPLQGRGGGQD